MKRQSWPRLWINYSIEKPDNHYLFYCMLCFWNRETGYWRSLPPLWVFDPWRNRNLYPFYTVRRKTRKRHYLFNEIFTPWSIGDTESDNHTYSILCCFYSCVLLLKGAIKHNRISIKSTVQYRACDWSCCFLMTGSYKFLSLLLILFFNNQSS